MHILVLDVTSLVFPIEVLWNLKANTEVHLISYPIISASCNFHSDRNIQRLGINVIYNGSLQTNLIEVLDTVIIVAGFIHSDGDVRYFGEEVPGVSQSFSEDQTFSYQDEEGTITVLGSPIKFDPPNLNFKEQ